MSSGMTWQDFDRAAASVMDEEFEQVAGLGLVTRESLVKAAGKICQGLHGEFPGMTGEEAEVCLRTLRMHCHETARKILDLLEDVAGS